MLISLVVRSEQWNGYQAHHCEDPYCFGFHGLVLVPYFLFYPRFFICMQAPGVQNMEVHGLEVEPADEIAQQEDKIRKRVPVE